MVEIFKTNVTDHSQAEKIIALLNLHFLCYSVNFDLHDCDNILRVKGDSVPINEIEYLVSSAGFYCSVLN
jgi:hypothetical protein